MKHFVLKSQGVVVIPAHVLARKLRKRNWVSWFNSLNLTLGQDYIVGFTRTIASGSHRKELMAFMRPESLLEHDDLNLQENYPQVYADILNLSLFVKDTVTPYDIIEYLGNEEVSLTYINKRVSGLKVSSQTNLFKNILKKISVNVKGWNKHAVYAFNEEQVNFLFKTANKSQPLEFQLIKSWMDNRRLNFWGNTNEDCGASIVIHELMESSYMRLFISEYGESPLPNHIGCFLNHNHAAKVEKKRVELKRKEVESEQRSRNDVKEPRKKILFHELIGNTTKPKKPARTKIKVSRSKVYEPIAVKKVWQPSVPTATPRKIKCDIEPYTKPTEMKRGIVRTQASEEDVKNFMKNV